MNERYGNPLATIINSAMKFLCVWGIIAQATTVLLAGNAGPDSESKNYINLLKNGGFETAKEQDLNYPADWTYYGGSVSGDWKLTKPGHEGKQCVRLWSDKPGYHGGVYQAIVREGNRRYKFSAWVKANISKGGSVTLLYNEGNYSFIQDGQKTNKYWGCNAGEKKEGFDWQYVEQIFETPAEAVGTFNATAYPVLFYGQSEAWVDDVRLVDLGPVKLGKETYSLSFDDPKLWKLSAHVNEAPAELPKGVGTQSDDKHMCDGKPGLKLNYLFPSVKHDAVMLTTDVSVPGGALLGLRVYGDGSGHELFAVLFDKSGEAHYLPIGPVYWRGWKTVYKSIAGLCTPPASKWDESCEHWGGDGNQTLEFPITRITIGLNDQPDEFKGKGEIIFGWLKIYE